MRGPHEGPASAFGSGAESGHDPESGSMETPGSPVPAGPEDSGSTPPETVQPSAWTPPPPSQSVPPTPPPTPPPPPAPPAHVIGRPPRRPRYLLPVVLITVGVVALLANTGNLPADWGWRLIQLWPAVLVLLGLELIIGAALPPRAAAIAAPLVMVLAVAGVLAWMVAGPVVGTATGTTVNVQAPLGSTSHARLSISVAGARLNIHTGDTGGNLYQGRLVGSAGDHPSVTFDSSSDVVTVTFNRDSFPFWSPSRTEVVDLTVSRTVVWDLELSGAGVNGTVELLGPSSGSVDLSGAGANVTVIVAHPSGTVPVNVSGAGINVRFQAPAPIQARIDASGVGSAVDFGSVHLAGIGSQEYTTNGYDSATDRFAFSVSGVGSHVSIEPLG